LNRTGFGGMPADITRLTAHDWPELVEQVLNTSGATPHWVGVPDLGEHRGYYERYVDMVWFWLERCRTSHAPLLEKMVLFWHGHLCSSMDKVYQRAWMFEQNQAFRTHGLGNFEDLVQVVSVQPAMLTYLDNDRNVAGAPNENFARELMELFTLGIGHYSEADVQAAARAWTGHGLNQAGGYAFNPWAHDWEPKTFFGDTRNWDGPMIVDHIINGPKRHVVARFIATKLWSFLAYPNPEPGVIDQVAPAFADSGMEIRPLIRAILLHPRFRSDRARTGLVRSPIEYVVHTMRMTGLSCAEAHPEWSLRLMGQEPFMPPNVAGWKQNLYWVNSAAVWAKAGFASNVRWRLFEQNRLAGSMGLSPTQAADDALALFGIQSPSAATRNALIGYVQTERQHTNWAERAGLLMLPMLAPEFQLA
jgi:uncharacterized protein (DUF1800 family)